MKKFSELNITYKTKDDKKLFDGDTVPLAELEGKTIIVEDFETGVRTKYGAGRTVVSFKYKGKDESYKFFSQNRKVELAVTQAKEQGNIPFETTIVGKKSGSKYTYFFS